jgi:hypothetical protein
MLTVNFRPDLRAVLSTDTVAVKRQVTASIYIYIYMYISLERAAREDRRPQPGVRTNEFGNSKVARLIAHADVAGSCGRKNEELVSESPVSCDGLAERQCSFGDLGVSWEVLGASWEVREVSWRALGGSGVLLAGLGEVWGCPWGVFGVSWSALGAVLGRSWTSLGRTRTHTCTRTAHTCTRTHTHMHAHGQKAPPRALLDGLDGHLGTIKQQDRKQDRPGSISGKNLGRFWSPKWHPKRPQNESKIKTKNASLFYPSWSRLGAILGRSWVGFWCPKTVCAGEGG